MTIELETFYSRSLGSFWWAEVGEGGREGGGGAGFPLDPKVLHLLPPVLFWVPDLQSFTVVPWIILTSPLPMF